jgi:hypothetical protein
MKRLNDLIEQICALEKKIETEAIAALKEAFKEFFARHPETTSISWRQWKAPYDDNYNYEFLADRFTLKIKDQTTQEEFVVAEVGNRGGLHTCKEAKKKLTEEFGDLANTLMHPGSYVLQHAFGYSVSVTASPQGFLIEQDEDDVDDPTAYEPYKRKIAYE